MDTAAIAFGSEEFHERANAIAAQALEDWIKTTAHIPIAPGQPEESARLTEALFVGVQALMNTALGRSAHLGFFFTFGEAIGSMAAQQDPGLALFVRAQMVAGFARGLEASNALYQPKGSA